MIQCISSSMNTIELMYGRDFGFGSSVYVSKIEGEKTELKWKIDVNVTNLQSRLPWWHESYSLGFPISWDYQKSRALVVVLTSIHFHPNSGVSISCIEITHIYINTNHRTKSYNSKHLKAQIKSTTTHRFQTVIWIQWNFHFDSCNPIFNLDSTRIFDCHTYNIR